MIRTTRAVLSTVAPSAALALAVVFASAALAPEAATAPETTAEAVAAAPASPTPLPSETPSSSGDGDRTSGSAVSGCCDPGSVPVAEVGGIGGDDYGSGAEVGSGGSAPAPSPTERVPAEKAESGVDVGVAIDPVEGPGSLSMTVAGASVGLGEAGSSADRRRFVGALPTVTVTDTRDAASIPSGASWFVLASAGDFVGSSGRPPISADHLGWTPALIGDESSAVRPGDAVAGTLDGGEGVRDAVLLATTGGSSAAAGGSWSAGAELVLGVEPSVAAGGYRSTLTLSLFE